MDQQCTERSQPERWDVTLLQDGQNDARLGMIFDAKLRFESLGIQFPVAFITPLLLAEKGEGESVAAGTRVIITLAVVRDEAGRLLTANMGLELCSIGIDESGQALQPSMVMNGTLNFDHSGLLADDIQRELPERRSVPGREGAEMGV